MEQLNESDYRRMLYASLPPGPAFSGDDPILDGMSPEYARAYNFTLKLITEADPRTAIETLPEWESAVGLPDPCNELLGVSQTIEERRGAVVSRLLARGGMSAQYYIDLAAREGYNITIDKYRPFTTQSRVDEHIYDSGWYFVWGVVAPGETVRNFNTQSLSDEFLSTWGNRPLECLIRPRKPSHTYVLFSYRD